MEPQLRERSGSGDGTPFSAFSAPTATDEQTGEPTAPGPSAFSTRLGQALQRGPAGTGERPAGIPIDPDVAAAAGDPAERPVRPERPAERAAAFRAATRRGRRPGQHPRRPRS
jgi:hypothetical protein